MVGASGAIAGLMGAFLVRLATTRIRFFYWFIIFRGTFTMPAYVALQRSGLLQQSPWPGPGGGRDSRVGDIGGFLSETVNRARHLAERFRGEDPSSRRARKTSWSASDQLTARPRDAGRRRCGRRHS